MPLWAVNLGVRTVDHAGDEVCGEGIAIVGQGLSLFAPGSHLGKYRIQRELGRGGMGVVYLAEDQILGRSVAIKVLHPSLTFNEDFKRRFQQEARSLASLAHPNIVHVNTFGEEGGQFFIESVYVDGGSLADLMASRGFTTSQVARHAFDVLQGLGACHGAGIVHRDVKPTNILVNADGRAMLSDFGIAKIYSAHLESEVRNLHSTGFFMGTPRYAPPESWEDQAPTPSWDIYSLGIVMYEGLTGNTPYDASSPMALLKQILERPIPPVWSIAPHVSEALGALVDDAVRLDPALRLHTADEFIERLVQTPEYLETGSVSAATIVTRVRKPAKPNVSRRMALGWRKAAPWLSVILLSALVALSVYVLVARRSPGVTQVSPVPPQVEAPIPTQTDEFAMSVSTKKTLAGLRRNLGSNAMVMDTVVHETQARREAHWLLDWDERLAKGTVIAADESGLWLLKMKGMPDGLLTFEGNWADYQGVTGATFRQGAIAGSGSWIIPGSVILAQLDFTNEQNNSRWNWTVSAQAAAKTVTDTRFLLQAEASDKVLPLLYNELLPRGLAWATDVERQFPAMISSRLRAAYDPSSSARFESGEPMATSVSELNPSNDQGAQVQIAGRPASKAATLFAHYDATGLTIAVRLQNPVSAKPQLRIGLLAGYVVPMKDTARWQVVCTDESLLSSGFTFRGATIPWQCEWRVRTFARADSWESMLYVPYANLSGVAAPKPGDRWRISCAIEETGANANAPNTPICQWGYPDISELEHGVILEFGPVTEKH